MSTMGLVYSPERGDQQQMMLIRTLQDAGTNNNNNNNNRPSTIVPKQNNVSVININSSQLQQTADNDNSRRQQQQQQSQQMPAYDPSRLKKHGKNGQPPPIAVAKRNARERNRVKQVNNGFATLRQHIPGHVAQGYGDRGKKLSKVETLRMAVEYIRGLQRLLAEADGLDFDANQSSQLRSDDSSIMIPSPTGSGYSGSGTHNGSGDVMGLTGSELDDQVMDEADDVEAYDDEDLEEKKDAKRFKEDVRIHSRLSENQNRDRSLQQPRRRVPQPVYYATKQSPSFGDEENIEPLTNRNNNNNLLTTYAPIVLQTDIAPIKREIHLLEDTERSPHQQEEAGQVVLATSSPYTGEILIENPETGRLVPLKLEDQLVYVTAATSAEGLPTTTYYRHDLGDAAAVAGSAEFMDVVSWWEQEQGRLQHQQTTHQLGQQRLAHV